MGEKSRAGFLRDLVLMGAQIILSLTFLSNVIDATFRKIIIKGSRPN